MKKWLATSGWWLAALGGIFPLPLVASGNEQVTIIETASTNVHGIRVTFDREGNAAVTDTEKNYENHPINERDNKNVSITLDPQLCAQFMDALENIGAMQNLSSGMCAKSASFGTSTFIEKNDEKSPDISCPGNASTNALWRSAINIIQAVRKASGFNGRN